MPPTRGSPRLGGPGHPNRRHSARHSVCAFAFLLALVLGGVPEAIAAEASSECALRVERALETVPLGDVTTEMRTVLLTACETVAAALASTPDPDQDMTPDEALRLWDQVLENTVPTDAPAASPTQTPTPTPRPRAPGYPVTGTTGGDDDDLLQNQRNVLSAEDTDAETGAPEPVVIGGPAEDGLRKEKEPAPSARSVVSLCVAALALVVILAALCVPSPFSKGNKNVFGNRDTGTQTEQGD